MDGERFCIVGSRLVKEADASISPFDRGFLYADGIFETLRVYNGKPFRLAEHWSRLVASAKFFGIALPREKPEALTARIVEANGASSAVIRFTLTRGVEPSGPRPGSDSELNSTLFVQLRELRTEIASIAENGVMGKRLPFPLRAKGIPLFTHKTLCYLPNVVALGKVGPGIEPIIENTDGQVAEGATSNIFWIKDKNLFTPAIEAGCLPGVTRKVVMDLARERGLKIDEGLFPAADILQAEEAFITNSVLEIAPLIKLDDQLISGGIPGLCTRCLQVDYCSLAEKETGDRFDVVPDLIRDPGH